MDDGDGNILNSKDMKRKRKKDKKKMTKDSVKDHKKDKQKQKSAQMLTISNENSVTDVHDNDNENNPHGNTDLRTSVIEIDKNNSKLCEVTTMINNNNNNSVCHKKSGAVYQFIEEKQKISLSKERRAARTLGIIMGNIEKRENPESKNVNFHVMRLLLVIY